MQNLLAQKLYNPVVNTAVGNLPTSNSGSTVLQIFLTNGMTFAFGLGILVLLVMLLIGAYEYITAGGDKEGLAKSSKRMTQAVIGLVLLFSIYLIAYIVGYLFGINVLQVNIPQLTP